MRTFWTGFAGAILGILVFVGVSMVLGQDIFQVEKDGTPRFKVTADGKIPVGSTGSYENLVIQNNAANPNARVDISADAITVEAVRLESLSVSATITASGAGGLDTGSEAGSTWYYVWVITNNDGTSSNGLLSTSSTSPTMPSGYTKKRRVGAVRNDASSNFLQFSQEGNKILYEERIVILTDGVALTYTAVSTSIAIPPTSRTAIAQVATSPSHSVGQSFTTFWRRTGAATTIGHIRVTTVTQGTTAKMFSAPVTDMPLDASQQFDYYINVVPDTSGGANLNVLGYYDRI